MTLPLKKLCMGLCLMGFSGFADARICVLSMFEKDGKESQMVQDVFQFYKQADIFREPSLQQIRACFESDQYAEIVWTSHGTALKGGISDYSSPVLVEEDAQGHTTKASLPVRFFTSLIPQLNTTHLKKIRVDLCNLDFSGESVNSDDPNVFQSTIEVLLKELRRRGVAIEYGAKFSFGSWLTGENLSNLTTSWLAQSIDRQDAQSFTKWRTEGNSYCRQDYWPNCDRDQAQMVIPTE